MSKFQSVTSHAADRRPLQLIRGLGGSKAAAAGSVLTIGSYDGLHRGHQALLSRVKERAARLNVPAVLLTFEPTPREYLAAADPPARLTSLRERWRILAGAGLDYLWLLRFGEALRNLTAEAFAQLLVRELAPAVVVVGHDFRFARNGAATAAVLAAAGERLGFAVDVLPAVTLDGERISSSGVRAALAGSDFERARRALGRPWSMRGRVQRGERLGTKLGFPTANLALERRRSPVSGIFAVRVYGIGGAPHGGVASLGTRPTVAGSVPLLEVHVFDFSGELYGRELEVEFVAKLREEERFATLAALVEQMRRDAAAARRILFGLK
ncbi:MAG TPA: bifunctional riboflavin kinase/FAD synthetase [Steroidobacteraceae bacterium]|jgi:riboflavin kinase/FMN adenylyltransferase|nr:bifunctional riboflavin kinase/FAD synthetase [Steroidobacteraceae bacterium]